MYTTGNICISEFSFNIAASFVSNSDIIKVGYMKIDKDDFSHRSFPLFLDAELLNKPLCPSVGLLVGLLVGVQLAFRAVFSLKYWRYLHEI